MDYELALIYDGYTASWTAGYELMRTIEIAEGTAARSTKILVAIKAFHIPVKVSRNLCVDYNEAPFFLL